MYQLNLTEEKLLCLYQFIVENESNMYDENSWFSSEQQHRLSIFDIEADLAIEVDKTHEKFCR